ncbi:hypothetical protein COOONC_08125 [Cooperia oncophora]
MVAVVIGTQCVALLTIVVILVPYLKGVRERLRKKRQKEEAKKQAAAKKKQAMPTDSKEGGSKEKSDEKSLKKLKPKGSVEKIASKSGSLEQVQGLERIEPIPVIKKQPLKKQYVLTVTTDLLV